MSLLDKFRAAKAGVAACSVASSPLHNSVAPSVATATTAVASADINVQKIALISVGVLAAVYIVPKLIRRFSKKRPDEAPATAPAQPNVGTTAGLELESWSALSKTNHVALFYTTWCGFSRKMLPIWESAVAASQPNITQQCVRVNGDVFKESLGKYNVPGFPHVVALDSDHELIEAFNGPRTKEALQVFLTKHLGDGDGDASDSDSDSDSDGDNDGDNDSDSDDESD